MKNARSGQVMPFCVLLIAGLLILILSNFQIGFLNFRKIQQQKKMDGIAMHYATDYARGLNALAALNQGLSITAQRGYMMAGVYTALAACAILTGICAEQFKNLSLEIVPFYIKLNKLGKSLAKQQDGIIRWMIKARCRASLEMVPVFDNFHLYPEFPCTFYPDYRGLPFYRPNETATENIEGVEDCKTQEFTSHNQFNSFADSLTQGANYRSPRFSVRYESQFKTIHHEKPRTALLAKELPASISRKVRDHYETFIFKKATVKFCTKFTQLLGKLTNDFIAFDIPSPLVFKDEFFEHGHKMIFIASDKIDTEFRNVYSPANTNLPKKVWATSEVWIQGDNFKKMEFKPQLNAITLDRELWSNATQKKPWVRWPNISENPEYEDEKNFH